MDISHFVRIGFGRAAAALGAAVALLSGCAPTTLLDRLTPDGAYEVRNGIAYGDDPRHRLDVYRPRGAAGDGTIVIFFYGGSWRSGNRAEYRFVAEALTRRGLVVVIADYRLYPDVAWPGFIDDTAQAVRWTRDHAAELGGDPRRVFLLGHSAGAYNAVMATLDARYLARAGLSRRDIAGVIGVSGPYDFLPSRLPLVQEVFATAAGALDAAQPLVYADGDAPPMLLLHGTADTTVYPLNSERLAERLRDAGARVRLGLYPARGHIDIMLGLSSVFDGDGRLIGDLLAFLQQPG